jgi:glycine cleavage system aminomethyltransferase T
MYEMFAQSPAFPFDPQVGAYSVCHPRYPIPLEYAGWQDENMSWKEACAIFAGLYPVNPVAKFTGPDVVRLLSDFTTSSYHDFKVGRLKHTTLCDDAGRILTHGLVVRIAEQEFHTYTLTPWLGFAASKGKYDVQFEDRTLTEFNFQCTGPRILEVLERATGECLHDIAFMGHRTSTINGKPVRLFRMGMAGTLGYEVHGHIDDARELYTTIIDAGKPYGIQRLGWKSYSAELCEGGFPQETFSFYGAGREDPGFIDFLKGIGVPTEVWPGSPIFGGSAGTDVKKRYRNPLEIGWHRSVSFEHEFRGKAALQKEAANPTRTIVTLVWNIDDAMDVYASLFRKGDAPYRLMDFPLDNVWRTSKAGSRQHQDDVLRDGKLVGSSTARVYSLFSRDMISTGVISIEHAQLGTELKVLWGDPATRQKEIRAVVSRYPHLALPSNSSIDVASIPCIRKKAAASA